MRKSPEVLISRLRNRKKRIVVDSVQTVACLAAVAVIWYFINSMAASLVPRDVEDPSLELARFQYVLAISLPLIGLLFLMMLFCAAFLGFSVSELIRAITGFSNSDLLVELWDRVRALESGRPGPPSGPPPQG
jgi:hypothetical protein